MPTLINSMQTQNPLGSSIASIGANMFNNGANIAYRKAMIGGMQQRQYGAEGLSNMFTNAPGGVVDPQKAAGMAVLAGLGADQVAGLQRYVGAMQGGPRSQITTDAAAGAGDYQNSAENLDLNRANTAGIAAGNNQTSMINTKMHVDAAANTAAMRARTQQWIADNRPVTAFVDGKPGFVRQGDPAIGPMIGSDPNQPNAAPTPYVQKTAAVESAGNPNAQNPNSSATGSQQFTDGTWLDVVSKHAPELMQGRTPQQVLALRSNPELSGFFADKYGQDNASVLKSQGLPVTDGTKYLAHFLGPGGAVNALKADPNAPVASFLDPKAIQANPQLAGMTAGGIRAWADKKMGVAAAPQGQPAPAQASGQPAPVPQGQAAPAQGQPPVQVAQAAAPQGQPPAHVITPMIKGPQAFSGMAMPPPVLPGPGGAVDPEAKKAYLDALTPSDRADVIGLTSGTKMPEQIALQGGARSRAVNLANGYDPTYSVPTSKARAALTQSEAANGAVGKGMTALDQATGHMGDYLSAAKGLHDTGNAQVNHVVNWLIGQNSAPNAATNAALGPMSSEIENVFRGSGNSTLEGIKQIQNSLSPDMPQSARAAAVAQLGGMLKDRMKSYADEHMGTFGNLDSFQMPDVRSKLQALGVDTKDLDPIYTAIKSHGGANVNKLPGGTEDPAAAASALAGGWQLAPDGQTKIRLKQ